MNNQANQTSGHYGVLINGSQSNKAAGTVRSGGEVVVGPFETSGKERIVTALLEKDIQSAVSITRKVGDGPEIPWVDVTGQGEISIQVRDTSPAGQAVQYRALVGLGVDTSEQVVSIQSVEE